MRSFCSGRDPAEDAAARHDRVQLGVGELVEAAGVHRARRRSSPARAARAATVSGSSPESTLRAMPSSSSRATVSGTSGRSSSASATSGQRLQRGQRGLAVGVAQRGSGVDGAGEDQDPQTLGRSGRAPRCVEVRARQEPGRGPPARRAPRWPRRSARRSSRSDGAERHLLEHRHRGPGQVGGQRRAGQVGARRRCGPSSPAPSRPRRRPCPPSGTTSATVEATGGQGAGLVGADDVDVAHRLDRVDPLHQRPAAGGGDRARGVGERR